jgi:SAM-dependent methyltransferase
MLFVEAFDRKGESSFDLELDQLVCNEALSRGTMKGYDNVGGRPTEFTIQTTNFREDVRARDSGSITRQRAVVCALSLALLGTPNSSLLAIAEYVRAARLRIYIADCSTALFIYLRKFLTDSNLAFSGYFGAEHRSGEFVDGVRHEDLVATSFPSDYFDVVVTSEVLEHIPDAQRAEAEIVRILRPAGSYIFTVPLDPLGEADTILAELDVNGTVVFHVPPVYHADPCRPEGILAYRIFSIADLERRFEALGCSMTTYRFWSRKLGILGSNSWVHVVRKGG